MSKVLCIVFSVSEYSNCATLNGSNFTILYDFCNISLFVSCIFFLLDFLCDGM